MSGRDEIDVICSLFLQRDEDISKLSVSYFLAEKSIAYLIILTETAMEAAAGKENSSGAVFI